MTASPAPLSLYLPLWGASFDSEAVGFLGGQVLVTTPFDDEWMSIQNAGVACEHLGELAAPPPCLTVLAGRKVDESVDSAIARTGTDMIQQGNIALWALRLYQPGWFLQPDLAEVYFAFHENFWHLRRRPGPYRQAFLTGMNHSPLPGYSLTIDALQRSPNDPLGNLSLLWTQLLDMQATGNGAFEIALENFNRSYGFHLSFEQRLAHLFMAIDALFGGFNATNPGGYKLKGSGSKFYQRIKAVFTIAEQDSIAAGRRAAWLNGSNPGEGRWFRNQIAHGEAISPEVFKTDESNISITLKIQEIVRLCLCQAMEFWLVWHRDQRSLSQQFNLPKDCSPLGAYNAVLAAYASKVKGAAEVLTSKNL